MIIGFGNNVVSALASDITATQTSFAVMPGSGEKFASLLTTDISAPNSPHGIYAKVTLTDSQQTVFEICHLMSVNQDTLTVLRGQEGTQAKGWSLNDVIANFATRGSEQQFVQIEELQAGDYTSAKAGGTANALAISLTSTFFNNESTDWRLNTPLIITPTVTNTGAATLQVTISGKVVGTYPLVKGNNTALQAGDIVAKNPFVVVFSSEQERFTVLNPTTEIGVVRSVNTIGPDAGGNVALPDASTTEKGLAQYSSATNSTSEALAATPKAVKAAYDLAAAALPKTGGTLTGGLNVESKISLSDGLELGNQKAASPAYIDFHTDGKATDYNARIISPQNSTEINLIAANNDNNGSGIIRMLGNKADQLSFALQGTAHSALALRKWGNTQRPTVLELDVDGGIWLMSIDHTEANKAALGVNGTVNTEILNASNQVQVGGARMASDGNIWGTRWNGNGAWLWDAIVSQINGIGQVSVSGNQWWAKINLNGATLILQGGRAVGSVADDGITERVGLNISVPSRLLHVSITIKNFAQGYETTWTPQVGDLGNERDGFNWLHGTQERDMYWFAVGY